MIRTSTARSCRNGRSSRARSTLLGGHLRALLAGLRKPNCDGLLGIGHGLLRPAALELALLELVHRLLDLLLGFLTILRHGGTSACDRESIRWTGVIPHLGPPSKPDAGKRETP